MSQSVEEGQNYLRLMSQSVEEEVEVLQAIYADDFKQGRTLGPNSALACVLQWCYYSTFRVSKERCTDLERQESR